ncbi:MAG: NRDE family protein [Gammaproteobacteria bacterium]|nr:NRDE family protein [Gammaproteobacteria bacterium]
MCLILFAWQNHPRYSLVVAANRDEFHQRPSADAGYWNDDPNILAGRDLQAGGTWLGITRTGRFAAITNYREPAVPEPSLEHSRGHLVRDYLRAHTEPLAHARELSRRGSAFRGFNLLLGSAGSLVYMSNRNGEPREISAGSHGLSNHLLDTDWPKVHAGRERLAAILQEHELQTEALFELLTDKALTPGEIPEDLGAHLAPERLMKHYFIVSPIYGTRCSTLLLVDREGGVQFHERQFDPAGGATGTRSFSF